MMTIGFLLFDGICYLRRFSNSTAEGAMDVDVGVARMPVRVD